MEIRQVEQSLETAVGEVANLSKYSIETGNALSELERYSGQYSICKSNRRLFRRPFSRNRKGIRGFVASISETESVLKI